MPANASGRSVPKLLLVIVFQLGLCVVLLAEVANAARGYDTLLALVSQLVGGGTAVAALLALLTASEFVTG